MSVLRSLESKIAGLVEGAFGRAFRSEVRPVELARKLAREMEDNTVQSVSRTYAPNEYVVHLSPVDRERFSGYEQALVRDLSAYLLEHARQERLALLAQPTIELRTDERLALGEFGIQARLVRATPTGAAHEPEQGDHGHTMIYTSAERLREQLDTHPGGQAPPPPAPPAVLRVGGKRLALGTTGAVVGRSRDCDVPLDDPNVSRRHAELRPLRGEWTISDLGSTNGVAVNGRRIEGQEVLRSGDRIDLGTSTVVFELDA